MAKREEADSGLRAGFITEDEAMRQRREMEARALLETFEIPEKPEKAEQTPVKDEPSPDERLKDLPGPSTIEIQGISGKSIPGVIKIIKKPKQAATEIKAEPPAAIDTVSGKMPVETEPETQPVVTPKAKPKAEVPEPPVPVVEKAATPKDKTKVVTTEKEDVKVQPSAEKRTKKKDTPAEEPKPEKGESKKPSVVKPVASKTAKARPADSELESKTTRAAVAKEPTTKPTSKPATRADKKEEPKPLPTVKRETPASPAPKQSTRSSRRDRRSIAELSLPITERITTPDPVVPSEQVRKKPATTSDGRPVRPQRGSYVGSDRDSIPMSERERPSRPPARPVRDVKRPPATPASPDREQEPRRSRTRRQTSDMPIDAPIAEGPPPAASRRQRDRGRQRDQEHRDRQIRREQQEAMERGARLRRQRAESEPSASPKRPVAQLTHVVLPEHLTVKELAEAIKKSTADVIMKLMGLGMMVTINQDIDYETAEIVVAEFGITSEKFVVVTEEDILFDDSDDDEKDLIPRPPVVVVMGHVDHGKTSILDHIRESSVTAGEAGGITQHIGAYSVKVNGRTITFLDTPGHEAFTTLRARGAQVTDIAILVVAADDGVMPQTVEAINHARAANTEIIVAINKIDRPEADIDRVKRELANYNLMDSDWGGQTTIVPVSAKTGQNMDELLDMILLTADVLELKANPNRQAKGTVIEAKLDKTRGPLATILIQRGTLRQGDTVVVGSAIGRVRMMYNDRGMQLEEAGPSMPVEIIGLDEVPEGGDTLYQVENERIARDLVEKRKTEERESALRQSSRMSLDTLFMRMADEEVIDLNIIVKADTQGSVEAMTQSLTKLTTEKIRVNVIHGAVGAITESDIRLAEVSDAIIIGINVRPASTAAAIAADSDIDIHLYRVIYEAIEEVERAMKGMLEPVFKEVVVGHAEVRNVFHASAVGTIAGCYITEGRVNRNDSARLVRDGIVIYETKLASLRRFKDDVREVAAGYECGISLDRFNDIKIGDEIEFYTMREVKEDA
jgi:translation initiation factor IF-2